MENGKIVIATDGSAPSAAAVAFGLELARARGAGVVALHVAGPRDVENVYDAGRDAAPSQAELRSASAALDEAAAAGEAAGVAVTVELVVAEGTEEVADAILGVAAGQDAGTIVMGTRGQGRIASAVLGSVSNAVLRSATATVIVVREPEESA